MQRPGRQAMPHLPLLLAQWAALAVAAPPSASAVSLQPGGWHEDAGTKVRQGGGHYPVVEDWHYPVEESSEFAQVHSLKRWCAESLCSIGHLFPHRVWPCSGHCRPHYHHNHTRLHTCNILAGPLSSLNSRLTRSSSLNQPTYPHTKMTLAKPVTDLLQAMMQTEASSRPTANEALIMPPCTYACD